MSGFYDRHKVCELTTFSTTTIRRKVKEGDFPKPRQLSKRRIGWSRDEVESWLKKAEEADNAPPA